MNQLSHHHAKSARPVLAGDLKRATRKKTKAPPPFSLRLSVEERKKLEEAAAGMPLGTYIKTKLFDGDLSPRRTRGAAPVKDHASLAQVLGMLGNMRLANNLNQLARAANIGTLPLTPEVEEERQRAQRQNLRDKQQARAAREAVIRAKRFRSGVRGMWDWLSGKTRKTRQQNEAEAADAARRDAQEREKMTFAQLERRRVLQRDIQKTKREITRQADDLRRDVAFYVGLRARKADDDNRTRRSKQRERPHNKPELER